MSTPPQRIGAAVAEAGAAVDRREHAQVAFAHDDQDAERADATAAALQRAPATNQVGM